MDPYLLYLFGIVAREMDLLDESTEALEQCVSIEPTLWCAWLEIAGLDAQQQQRESSGSFAALQISLASSFSSALVTSLPRQQPHDPPLMYRIMQQFFHAHLYMEMQESEQVLRILNGSLLLMFAQSSYVQAQIALAHYSAQDFDTAQQQFETLYHTKEPYRFEQLDIYSNILYVKEAKAELSLLAHEMITKDKYRPETCCIVGNYYSIKGDHEKAVMYFKRALKLDRRYLSAWTLMGHEYVELKNTAAAVHAYRTAFDINPRDYRALYGLGQTYEVLNMHIYAIYYYSRATNLRPNDGRMWVALGQCYEQLGKIEMAIACYQRAREKNDPENIAFQKLSELIETQTGATHE